MGLYVFPKKKIWRVNLWKRLFIAVIVVPVVAYYIGKEFEYIANEKGYTSKKYFWWTFLFGAVGISMVIALPDRRGGTGAASSGLPMSDDEIPEI